jgi:hypothetical protein
MRLVNSVVPSNKGEIGRTASIGSVAANSVWFVLSGGALSYAVYIAVNPVQWSDSGFYLAEVVSGERLFNGPLAHPGYIFVASTLYKSFGMGALFALNATANAISSYLIFKIARELGASTGGARIGASAFFVSQPAFWLAANVEVYPLHNVILMLGISIVLRSQTPTGAVRLAKFIVGASLVAVSVLFHQLSALVLPVIAVSVFQALKNESEQLRSSFRPALFVSLGAAILLAITALAVSGALAWISEYLGLSGSGQRWSTKYFQVLTAWRDAKYVFLALYGIGVLILAFFLPGRNDRRVSFLKLAAVVQLGFVLTYEVPDRAFFLLPALSFLSILFALLLDRIPRWCKYALASLAIVSHAFVGMLTHSGLLADALFPQHYNVNPYRSNASYFLAPYFKDASAQRFVEDLNAIVSHYPNKVVTLVGGDWTPMGALVSARATGYARNIETMAMKDLEFGSDGCPRTPSNRLNVVFRLTDFIPLEDGCLYRLGRLLAIHD